MSECTLLTSDVDGFVAHRYTSMSSNMSSRQERFGGIVVLTVCMIFFGANIVRGQGSSSGPWFVRGGFTSPYILPSSPFVSSATTQGGAVSWVPDLTVEVGRQTNGSEPWHQLY